MTETVAAFFAGLDDQIDPVRAQGLTATFQFEITGEGGGKWYVDIRNGEPQVTKGSLEAPDITIIVSADDWLKIVNGEMNAQMAFVTGKVKLKGDMTLAMKLQTLIRT